MLTNNWQQVDDSDPKAIALENETARAQEYKAFNIKQMFDFLNIKDEYWPPIAESDPLNKPMRKIEIAEEMGINFLSPAYQELEIEFDSITQKWRAK